MQLQQAKKEAAKADYAKRVQSRFYILGTGIIIIQLIQLYKYLVNPQFKAYFNGLLTLWISSKVFCVIIQLYITKNTTFLHKLKIFLRSVFSTEIISMMEEIYTEKELLKSLMLGAIGQIHVYALPVFLINNYIIVMQESKQGVDTLIYVIMIVNIVLISLCNLLVQVVKNTIDQLHQPFLFSIMSLCRCFIFWHILGQFYVMNYVILISWIITHIVIAFIFIQYLEEEECRAASFISYLFQLELFLMREKKAPKTNLTAIQCYNYSFLNKSWSVLLYIFFLQTNLIFFMLVKTADQPLLVKMDYLIYALFPFLLPQLIWTIELFYNKATKFESCNEIVCWRAGELHMNQKMCRLTENLLCSGKIFVELDGINKKSQSTLTTYKNKIENIISKTPEMSSTQFDKNLCKDVREIKEGLKLARKGNFQQLDLEFHDISQSLQIVFSYNQYHNYTQKLTLRQNYNEQLAVKTIDLMQHILNTDHPFDYEGKEITLLKLRFQVIRFELVQFNAMIAYKELYFNVLAQNFSAYAFYKQLSQHIPLNPSLILYDLLEDNV